ncbi:MAG: DinB family protein [Gemmatimonadetes bacterium]|nr:DinB family protein [Gemmatimonadota bacterium]
MNEQLREFLANMLDWQQAHASFDSAIADLPASLRGERPEGLPYSVWELVEHIRIAQNDILEFARDPGYKEDKKWPDDYWPETPAPQSAEAWETSINRYHGDVEAFKKLIHDPAFDPFAKVPWGNGQTNIREVVLVFDHTAYHVGQIVLVRRLLGAWK